MNSCGNATVEARKSYPNFRLNVRVREFGITYSDTRSILLQTGSQPGDSRKGSQSANYHGSLARRGKCLRFFVDLAI